METARPLGPPPSSEAPAGGRPETDPESGEPAGLDAALPEAEWECVLTLRRAGVTDAGFLRLLRLRIVYRRDADPVTDGLQRDPRRDPRALFARWLVAQGHLNEGLDEGLDEELDEGV
jgi:hypothetical protein